MLKRGRLVMAICCDVIHSCSRSSTLKRGLLLLITLAILGSAVALGRPVDKEAVWQVVADWPRLPADIILGQATGVATDAADRVFVFHRGKRPILVLDAAGKYLRSWGDGLVKTAHGLRLDREQNVWITDLGNHTVTKFDPQGNVLLTLGRKGKPGLGRDQFNRPADIAFDAAGAVYVADGYGNSRVVKFSKEGTYLKEWGKKGKGDGEFNLPHAIRIDERERVYVGDRENNRVQIFDKEGAFLQQWRDTGSPYGLFLTNEKHMLLADGRGNVSKMLELDGKTLERWGQKGSGPGQFLLPHGICMDSTDAVYVTEVDGKRVQKFVRQ